MATEELADLARSQPGHGMRRFWTLESSMYFLNHGSFGATPRHVLTAQQNWRHQMERQPVRFMTEELPSALQSGRQRLAQFLGTSAQRIAFVENATDAANAVLRSWPWRRGDEIVIANHAYPAIRKTLGFVADRHGLQIRQAQIAFPVESGQAIVDAFCAEISDQTRLVIVDHVFSPLALVTPIEKIISFCKPLGVKVLVDGAHGPAMLPLALDTLGADWYAGNCHKWLLAPKACAFIYAAPAVCQNLHPTVISNFHGDGFPAEFDWQGTRDYSAWLAVTAALDFLQAFGVDRYRKTLHSQARAAAQLISCAWQIALPAPPELFAAMVTLRLPAAEPATETRARQLHDRLWRQHRIEVPVLAFNEKLWVRISAQIYNELSDYQMLAEAMRF